MPNYNVVDSYSKEIMMNLGMDEGTAQVLARGRRFWLPYGDRKPIIETDWKELYDIYIKGAFPMGFKVDKSIKESHKRGFMNLLSEMQTQLRWEVDGEDTGWRERVTKEYRLKWENRLNQINNWNRAEMSYEFLNWQENPWEVKG